MEWIRCSDRLPFQGSEENPTYISFIVTVQRNETREPWPFAIARYTHEGWNLRDEVNYYSPALGDVSSSMNVKEITHWFQIEKPKE